jgi:hypothetical protein
MLCVGLGAPQQTHFLPEPSGFATSKAKLAFRQTATYSAISIPTSFGKIGKSAQALSERILVWWNMLIGSKAEVSINTFSDRLSGQ